MPRDDQDADVRLAEVEKNLADAFEELSRLRQDNRYLLARNAAEMRYSSTLSARIQEQDKLLGLIEKSTSWRLTAPLRFVMEAMRPKYPRFSGAKQPRRRTQRPTPQPTLFIECTHTYYSHMNTGIQRVVRNILQCAPDIAKRYGLRIVPVIVFGDAFYEVDVGPALLDKQHLADGVVAPSRGTISPDAIRLDEYKHLKGSTLLLLDASWDAPLWPAVQRFRDRGGRVAAVIYDLIPITHSYATVDQLSDAFAPWLCSHLRHSEGFVCISRATADELSKFIHQRSDDRAMKLPIDHFYLGSKLDFVAQHNSARGDIKGIFDLDRHYFLVVGSIEPRKKHPYILDAFERLWGRGEKAMLVIIGSHSWKSDDLFNRIADHPERGRQLFLIRDASDAQLDYAYRNASGLIIASEIEGFGLPVVEAFQRGLPVLCSDIPVFREIADGRATFFGLEDSTSLTNVLSEFCASHDPTQRRERQPQQWISWKESTEQLFAAVDRMVGLGTGSGADKQPAD